MRVSYNKLIRDRIPEIIEQDGHQAVTRVLAGGEYQAALLAKLVEEAHEARTASVADLPSELADVLEVLQALAEALNMTWEDLLAVAADKCARRARSVAGCSSNTSNKPTRRGCRCLRFAVLKHGQASAATFTAKPFTVECCTAASEISTSVYAGPHRPDAGP